MGRGDRKSKKGKIFRGSYGKTRPRKKPEEMGPGADPGDANLAKSPGKKKK